MIKFGLWFAWLSMVFVLLKRGKVTDSNRILLLAVPVVIFGIVLGSDPNPMGTVKDGLMLLIMKGVIFPPRAIAFVVFLLLAIVANKLICAWGCQLGTLQDLLFRLMQKKGAEPVPLKARKIPFAISNTIRIASFAGMVLVAWIWGVDVVEKIDPFRIFKPAALGVAGILFTGMILVLSLFIYRPWCHLFCPFGLVGWLAEKISVFRIRINRDACTQCRACAKACPSKVMEHILDKKKSVPDCFACGQCQAICPEKAITFSSGPQQEN